MSSYVKLKSFVERNRNCLAYGKFGHWRSKCSRAFRSASKSAAGINCLGMDENRKCDVCFLDYPCDWVDGSSFKFEDVVSVRSFVELLQVSVKGRLWNSIDHWKSLGAPDFILNIIS